MGKRHKASRPQKHHWLPQFYLAGFTASGEKTGSLWTTDLQRRVQRSAAVKKVACERDLYRIDSVKNDPFCAEDKLGDVEGRVAPVIRKIIAHSAIPGGEEFQVLMEFIATMALRMPWFRNMNFEAMQPFKKEMEEGMRIHPHQDVVLGGSQLSFRVSQSEMRQDVKDLRDPATFTHNLHMPTVMRLVPDLVPLLSRRRWSLIVADNDAGDYITCDCPVRLAWFAPPQNPAARMQPAKQTVALSYGKWRGSVPPPGFGCKRTYLVFPLDRRTALDATFELPGQVTAADKGSVAALNGLLVMGAHRYLYSAQPDFCWMDDHERIRVSASLLEQGSQGL